MNNSTDKLTLSLIVFLTVVVLGAFAVIEYQLKAADKEAQKLIGHLEEIKKSIDSISIRQQNIKAAEH